LVNPQPSTVSSKPVDVTFFRNYPTEVVSLTTTDPFGPAAATLTFHSITILDALGHNDLSWCIPEANVDIMWMSPQTDISGATIWDSSVSYVVGNIVNFGGVYYKNISAVTSATTPDADTTHWSYFDPAGAPLYTWEGYFVSFEFGEEDAGSTLTIQCNGAMKQMDNYLAYPEYLIQPMSYEFAIERQFDTSRRSDSRMRDCIPFKETAKTDSNFAFMRNSAGYAFDPANFKLNGSDAVYTNIVSKYFLPINLHKGDIWSLMLTRSTGNFEPVLSTYIQNLLSSMQTSTGSFSLMLGAGRQPYFKHRTRLTQPASDTLYVDLLWPGVKVSATQDYTQKINVVYGKGKALNGDAFSNLVFDADGAKSHYEPFAYKDVNYPRTKANASYDKNRMSKEVQLNFYDGLSASDAVSVAKKTLDMHSNPGITGTLTLTTDPQLFDGTGVPRQTLTAGRTVVIKNIFGNSQGILFHITEHNYSSDGSSVSLTFDSKYRDQLTVQEIRKRGRDSLVIPRLLGVGQFAPNIDDLLFPWSYEQGSGYVPLGSQNLWKLINKAGNNTGNFPWTTLTGSFSPKVLNAAAKKHSSSSPYAGIYGPASKTNADKNWSAPVPVMFSAKGTITSVRFAAFKADGTPYNVPFHVSLWYENAPGLSYTTTPSIPTPDNHPFQLTNNIYSNTGKKLHAVLTMGITEGTGNLKGTVTATLKFSSAAKDTLISLSKTVTPIMIKDAKYISKGTDRTNKWFSNITVDVTNFKVTFPVDKTLAVSMTRAGGPKVLTETVKEIYVMSNWKTTPAALHMIPAGFTYTWAQHYPFYKGAWEKTSVEGVEVSDYSYTSANTPIAAWGNFYEQAGYYPATGGNAQTPSYAPPTGQFADETPFSYDFTSQTISNVIPQNTPTENTGYKKSTGHYSTEGIKHVTGSAMFYCDQEWDSSQNKLVPRKESVYFIGRLYRQPPGA
jgi:hypothetical protein